MASDRTFSRRRFLGVLGGGAAMTIVAACGGGQQAAPAPKQEAKPADAKPTGAAQPTAAAKTESKPAAPAAAQPTTAAAAKADAKPAAGQTVVVWQALDYLPQVTALMKERFEAVSKEKSFTLNFEELPSGKPSEDRFLAAVQAGTPPDIWRTFDYQNQYWRIQGQTVDLTDVVQPVANQQGGYWQPVVNTLTFENKWWAAPMAVNAWPFHVRQDLLEKNGLQYPKTWDEVRQQGKQLSKAPFYYYGFCAGKTNDTNNHFIGMLWTFGGKLQNEDGSLAVKEGDEAWINTLETLRVMFAEDQIIPPGAVNWDDTQNNQGYQSEQLFMTSNPTSVYNWLLQNKADLAKGTKFYSYPAGPAGSFGQVDVWGQSVFKNGKGREGAMELLKGFIEPTWYAGYVNDQLKGRFIPVYKDMINAPLWKQDLYSEYQNIINTGRIMAYGSTPLGAISELTTKYIIGDLLQDVLVKRQRPADALATFVRSAKEIYDKPENRR